jgi:small-conductance mechanosensitive channel
VVVARLARRGVERALRRTDAERHVVVVVATLAFYVAVALGLVVALSIGGVNLGVLIGSLGLATVALGFALQDIVSNFTAGIVLLLEHPFTEGDHIAIAEAEGEVEEIPEHERQNLEYQYVSELGEVLDHAMNGR